jgi:hypothetical protein
MKKAALVSLFLSISFLMNAQEEEETSANKASFELGSGLNFSFNQGAYQFNISGFIQPNYVFEETDGSKSTNELNSKRSFFMLSGKAEKEKVSFMLQMDFSISDPLMDAWVAYHPTNYLTIYAGQKQTFVNNKEMMIREDRLQFNDRSFLSENMSETGREMGIFIESKFGTKFGIAPKLAFTSGDGRNSFGADSRDTDIGGFKLGGRLDIYPLGFFKDGIEQTTTDLLREEKFKFVVGVAFSNNNGASSANGEGHGDFLFYDSFGNVSMPDYDQLYADILLKYKGFSFLGEYNNSTASDIKEIYTDATALQILVPQQISSYYLLGDNYNFQGGYVTKNGFSFDARYEVSKPEFSAYADTVLKDTSSYTIGLTKYFKGNNLKLQTSFTSLDVDNGNDQIIGSFLMQIVF